MSRSYRGLTGKIRYAINSGKLKGELNEDSVREILDDEKFSSMPDGTITKSLAYMAKKCEVQKFRGRYFSKEEPKMVTDPVKPAPQASQTSTEKLEVKSSDVCVIGKLVGTSLHNGRMIANIEVTTLDYK